MLGNNPIRKQIDDPLLLVTSIFRTIQGEGPFAGMPAIFIRLGGCNLQCEFCDTDFETDNTLWTVEQIGLHIDTLDSRKELLVITGGEPFRQNISQLIDWGLARFDLVQIETNGTLSLFNVPWYNRRLKVVISPKTPKIKIWPPNVSYKYIIKHGDQYNFNGLPILESGPVYFPMVNNSEIYIQPMDEYDIIKHKLNMRACVEIAYKFGYRISLQTHKILGVE